jgi:hypothetical protein
MPDHEHIDVETNQAVGSRFTATRRGGEIHGGNTGVS